MKTKGSCTRFPVMEWNKHLSVVVNGRIEFKPLMRIRAITCEKCGARLKAVWERVAA